MDDFKLPPEAWAAIGAFVTGNIGAIWAVLKSYFKRETDQALIQQRLDFMNQTLGEMKAGQIEMKKDLDAAFELIRKYTAKVG